MEFIWLLNSHPEVTFAWMHGDKDTYRLAFHMANKSSDFAQVRYKICSQKSAKSVMKMLTDHCILILI